MPLDVRDPDPAAPARVVGVWAVSMRADQILVIAPGRVEPGTPVAVPLQTVDATTRRITGIVEACVPVRGGEHRTRVRFDHRVNPARFAVCWGIVIDPDGSLIEITSIARRSRERGARPARVRAGPTDERAAMVVTVAIELARRASEGADDAEMREITGLLDALLEKRSGSIAG